MLIHIRWLTATGRAVGRVVNSTDELDNRRNNDTCDPNVPFAQAMNPMLNIDIISDVFHHLILGISGLVSECYRTMSV